jgi:hypothetical protein
MDLGGFASPNSISSLLSHLPTLLWRAACPLSANSRLSQVGTITDDNGPAEADTKEHKLPDLIVRRTLIVNEQPGKRREGRSWIAHPGFLR